MRQANFMSLVKNLKIKDGVADTDAASKLWRAALDLPFWYVLMTERTAAEKKPGAQRIGEKNWFLAFTDLEKLTSYATRNKNLDKEGNPQYLKMPPADAIKLAERFESTNVFGFRFDEGTDHGWYIPLADLIEIPYYLQRTLGSTDKS